MDVEVIGVDSDGLLHSVGEGIFGYDTPDGSLGASAFNPPQMFANRLKQGVFWTPYSYQSNEVAEPEQQWALERWPGLPRFPGSSAQGLLMVGPAMGGMGEVNAGGVLLAVVGVIAAIGALNALANR